MINTPMLGRQETLSIDGPLQMAGKKIKAKPKQINLTAPEMQELITRVKDSGLAEKDCEIIEAMAETIQCLSQALEEKATSIKRLLNYLFGSTTETAKNVLPEDESRNQTPKPQTGNKPRPKGHGRNGASSYTGAERVIVAHPELKSGDPCPACPKGKVYELSLPAVTIRITGTAPLNATVYELSRLRCNLCGMLFTAPSPEESKWDDSATAMIALLKYGCGMPFYRMEKLQANMGMPVPASTQWELIDAGEKIVFPAFESLLGLAAQGNLVHNDDTAMKILGEIHDPESTRKGIYTTGVISFIGEHRIAIFMTGRNHAGENLGKILKQRASGLAPPQQMCDGGRQNITKGFKTILINCMAHARRQFVDVFNAFPEECRHVIEVLGVVYHHDDQAKGLSPDERMALHKEKSAPLMKELETWCREQFDQRKVEPNSELGKAINYLLNRWDELTRFLHIPGAPLDNNICERALKLAVLHRKNSYFFKTLHGAHVGDVFMSLIHTCQLAGENPFDYLTALLRNGPKVAKTPDQWLPWNYRSTLSLQK
jgi:transposase